MENNRYQRQIMLPEIGCEGQTRLSQSRVVIVGVGGLGSPVALYLAAAGVGHIGLVDSDNVSLTNLHRQILYNENDVGNSKTDCARNSLQKINSSTNITCYHTSISKDNSEEILSQYDIVVDCCDNASTRYLIDDECARQNKPWVYGAITQYTGQLSVFDAQKGWRYTNLFPDREYAPLKAQTQGVLGTLPGIIGTLQATEVIKLITGLGTTLIGKLFTIDLRTLETSLVSLTL